MRGAGGCLRSARPAAGRLRPGFVIDLVGYSDRTEPAQRHAQERIVDLTYEVVEALGVTAGDTFVQPTGDGMNVFLPVDIDYSRALGDLRRLFVEHLLVDNGRNKDRLRFRMAVDIGPCRLALTAAAATRSSPSGASSRRRSCARP
jgi:hypothetical protein